jgi:hypothetical protein
MTRPQHQAPIEELTDAVCRWRAGKQRVSGARLRCVWRFDDRSCWWLQAALHDVQGNVAEACISISSEGGIRLGGVVSNKDDW